MNRKALLSLFDHLRSEARDVMHATDGWMQAQAEAAVHPALQERLNACRVGADRLAAIIDDIREVLGAEPRLAGAAQDFDLARCLEETVDLLNLTGAPGRLDCQVQSTPIAIRQHRAVVEQVLSGILEGSLRSSERDTIVVSAASAAEGAAVIRIRLKESSGNRRIWEWMNATPENAGFEFPAEVSSGISLLLAGQRLRSIGGNAQLAESADPAALTLLLPSIAAEAATQTGPAPRADALNILVAEDCDDSFALTRLMLPGEQLERARTGVEAIAKVKERRFDVIFMDIHMPGMDGYRAIAAIRDWETKARNARTPIVVISSDEIETQKRSAAQAGCSGYLRKPVRPGDMAGVIARVRALRN